MAWACGFCGRALGKCFMRYFASMLGGFVLAFLVFMLVLYPRVKCNWYAQGRVEGYLAANVSMYRTAVKYFSNENADCYSVAVLGGAKPDVMEIVDCGAFRSLPIVARK